MESTFPRQSKPPEETVPPPALHSERKNTDTGRHPYKDYHPLPFVQPPQTQTCQSNDTMVPRVGRSNATNTQPTHWSIKLSQAGTSYELACSPKHPPLDTKSHQCTSHRQGVTDGNRPLFGGSGSGGDVFLLKVKISSPLSQHAS